MAVIQKREVEKREEKKRKEMAKQVFISYCHRNTVKHEDLASQNLIKHTRTEAFTYLKN